MKYLAKDKCWLIGAVCFIGLLLGSTSLWAGHDPDLNNDGIVDILDVSIVTGCTAKDPATNPQCEEADTDQDGDVDVVDLNPVVAAFGQTGFPVAVPNLIGLPQAEAVTALQAVNLAVGVITEATSTIVPAGAVKMQSIMGGTEAVSGTSVDLILSTPVPDDLTVPGSWVGRWDVTLTTKRPATGSIVNIDEFIDVSICPNDPLGLTLFDGIADCAGMVTDNIVSRSPAQQSLCETLTAL